VAGFRIGILVADEPENNVDTILISLEWGASIKRRAFSGVSDADRQEFPPRAKCRSRRLLWTISQWERHGQDIDLPGARPMPGWTCI